MKTSQICLMLCLALLTSCATAPSLEGGGGSEPVEEEPAMPAPAIEDESPATSIPAMPVATTRPDFPETAPTVGAGLPFESSYSADMVAPIFYGSLHRFILLGATSQGVWLQAQDVYGLLYEEAMYDFYFSNEYLGAGIARVRPPENQGAPGYCNSYSVDQDLVGGEPPSFGLRRGQPVVIPSAEEMALDAPIYQQYVADWLRLQALPNPVVNITRILRVDLEGDGVDEVLISASHFTEETGHMVVVEDYSLVLLRRVVGDVVYTTPLVQDVYYGDTPVLSFPVTYFLDTVFDLNGDGNLEVIVSETWWEGWGYSVYELHGINAVQVLRVMCGYVMQQ